MRHYLSLLALVASLILFPASSCGKQPGGESGENPGIDNPPAEEIGTEARNELLTAVMMMDAAAEPHSLEINYTTLFDKITNKIETLSEIENELTELLNCTFSAINLKKANKVNSLINEVCDFIAKNYSDPNLSTAMIADSVKISQRYLSKIFAENMPISLPSYITNYRIEKSKEYLLNTDFSIKEIVDKIGWINLKYFYTIFKKTTGTTPGDFRASSRKTMDR